MPVVSFQCPLEGLCLRPLQCRSLGSNMDGMCLEWVNGELLLEMSVLVSGPESTSWNERWMSGFLKGSGQAVLSLRPSERWRREADLQVSFSTVLISLSLRLPPSSRWTRCRKLSSITPSASRLLQRGGTSLAAFASWGSTHRWASFLLKAKSSKFTSTARDKYRENKQEIPPISFCQGWAYFIKKVTVEKKNE